VVEHPVCDVRRESLRGDPVRRFTTDFLDSGTAGDAAPHDNMPPFLVVNHIIALVGLFLVDRLEDPDAAGTAHPVGGPDVFTPRRIAELAFETLDKPPRIRGFPGWTLRAASAVVRPFNINVSSLLSMFGTMLDGNNVTTRFGTHRPADHYRALAARSREQSPSEPAEPAG
jgi:hypothetical protein